jgi:hypothetical protein
VSAMDVSGSCTPATLASCQIQPSTVEQNECFERFAVETTPEGIVRVRKQKRPPMIRRRRATVANINLPQSPNSAESSSGFDSNWMGAVALEASTPRRARTNSTVSPIAASNFPNLCLSPAGSAPNDKRTLALPLPHCIVFSSSDKGDGTGPVAMASLNPNVDQIPVVMAKEVTPSQYPVVMAHSLNEAESQLLPPHVLQSCRQSPSNFPMERNPNCIQPLSPASAMDKLHFDILLDDPSSPRQSSSLQSPRPDGKKVFYCSFPDCNRFFTQQSNLKVHSRVHTNERPFTCAVLGCGKKFKLSSHLKVHMKTH